jgi:hypothetical protein
MMRGQAVIARFQFPQAATSRELGVHQADQMIPGIEALVVFITVVLFDALVKNSFRKAF